MEELGGEWAKGDFGVNQSDQSKNHMSLAEAASGEKATGETGERKPETGKAG
jgi:hypothetical protein